MRKTKKTLAILAIVAMVLTMLPIQVFAATNAVTRLADVDRVGTAIAIANSGWTSAGSVIVAPADSDNLVDALAVAPLAGQLKAPILMTYKNSLDSRVQSEISTLKATNVYAIGALSSAVVSQLKAISGVTVTQIQGADRFATAAQVAAQLKSPAGSFVVGYNGLADAMSAASYAAANNYAILIANPDGSVPANEVSLEGSKVYTVGGSTLVADIAGATRLAGANRYDTNDQVLKTLTYKYDKVYVANGDTLVDALAGSALAAQTNSAIVLANTSGAAAAADVNKNMSASSQVVAFGGSAVVPDSVVTGISTGTVVTPPPAAAGLSVSANMAAAQSVAIGQYLANVGTITFTATGADATVTGLKVTRTGLSKDSDVAHITVWNGATRLNAPAIVSSGVADIGFLSPLTIKAGTSQTVNLKADIDSGAQSGEQIVLSLADASAIKTTATVTSNLPVSSGVITLAGNIHLGDLTVKVAGDTASGSINASTQGVSLAKYTFSPANEDVTLTSITFTNDKSAADSDVANFVLYNGTTQIATAASMQNRKVSFTFNPGLKVTNGSTLSLELKGDTQASIAGRDVQMNIDDPTDVQGVGGTYGTAIVGDLNGTSASSLTANDLAVNTGTLTVGLDTSSPAAGTVGKGTSGYTFAALNVQAKNEPVQLQKIVLAANPTGGADAADLQNVAILNGTTVLGKVQNFFSDTTANTTQVMTLSNPITINPGTPVVLQIQADLKSTAAAGNFVLGLASGSSSNQAITAQGTISGKAANYPASGSTTAVLGNSMTVGNAQLTYAFGTDSATVFGSQPAVQVGTLTLSHNLSKNVAVSQINLNVSASSVLSNLRLTDTSGNVISSTVGTVSAGDSSLRLNTPLQIAKSQNVTVDILADVIYGASTGETIQIGSGTTPITAYTTDDGNAVATIAGTTGLMSQTLSIGTSVSTTNGVSITTSNVANLSNFNVGLGQTGVKVAAATLITTTANEPVILKKVTLGLSTGNNGDISNVRIVDGSGNVLATVGNLPAAGNYVTQTLSTPLTIPKYNQGAAEIAVLADFTTDPSSAGDGPFVFQFGSGSACLNYNGQISGTAGTTASATVTGVQITLNGSTLGIAKASVANVNPPAASGVEIGRVTFTNTGATSIDIKKIGLEDVLNASTTGLSSAHSTTSNLMVIDSNSGKIYMASTTEAFGTTGGPDGDYQQLTLGSAIRLAPGASATISIMLSQNNGITQGNGLMLKVLGAYTSFDATNGGFTNQVMTGTNAGLDTIIFKSNT